MQINVTKSFLPPLAEYQAMVGHIFDRCWLTNHGPLVNELERKLMEYLGLAHLLFVSNGTIALQLALKALRLTGEVITTPFSYVATTSSIVWEGLTPVMADIDPDTLTIDPAKIEAAVTKKTSAILATHVYGNACRVEEIAAIAKRHNLAVIYDAAHAFGTLYKGKSLYAYGDVSTASFHATKLFHTVEGGAVITQDPETARLLGQHRNFGHVTPTSFEQVGINGKNSEFHAAMGLCVLPQAKEILMRRKELSLAYDAALAGLPLRRPSVTPGCDFNYAYYPVLFESEAALLDAVSLMNTHNVFPRRYFYPSLSQLPYVNTRNTPMADDIARRALCLPLYHDLTMEELSLVAGLLRKALSKATFHKPRKEMVCHRKSA